MNEAELERLYARLEKPVFNVVYRWVWDADQARDLVQEAFVRLWRMRARVRDATVEPLVYRIALNLARSAARRRRLWRWVSLEALPERAVPAAGADDALTEGEASRAVRDAVRGLPEPLRRVVMLTEFSGLTHDQIGQALGIAPGTVASRRHRALKHLRSRLAGEAAPLEREPEGV